LCPWLGRNENLHKVVAMSRHVIGRGNCRDKWAQRVDGVFPSTPGRQNRENI